MKTLSTYFLSFIVVTLMACSPDNKTIESAYLIETVSTKSEFVVGDAVLVKITAANGSIDGFDVLLNGTPIDIIFVNDSISGNNESFVGLVQDLKEGSNHLSMSAGKSESINLEIQSHPVAGPVFSGPQQAPYLCLPELTPGRDGTARGFAIGNGESLDFAQMDANCHIDRQRDFVYVSSDENIEGFLALKDLNVLPDDIAIIERDNKRVPYVVMIETGTINRAIYQIAALVDPLAPFTLSTDSDHYQMAGLAPWNKRLVYTFGGGCEAGFHQGTSTGGVLRKDLLAEGYAIASSTLNVNRQGGCNDVISAETAMMVKEHFSETWGLPNHTIGLGGSGGAMQQHLIANAYPGILDGLIVGLSFPDPITYFMDSAECALPLREYLNNRDLTDEIKNAIGGWHQWSTCDVSLGQRPARISPYDCAGEIPPELAYDEFKNPQGIRCSIYDGMKNVFGQVPHPRVENLMVAPSPHDNIGVQYGLRALQAGLITKKLFLDVNENVGGWDIDYQPTKERTQAYPDALAKAYSTGRIANGKSLGEIPIIDDRAYLDDIGNFHTSVYSFSLRARLIRDNGNADNHVIRRHQRSLNLTQDNVRLMDQWLTELSKDHKGAAMDAIRAAKPSNLSDDCFTEQGDRIVESAQFTEADLYAAPKGQCNSLYPVHGNPRIVAGAPLTGDIMKCELKPINWREYGVEFSETERERLTKIFPEGVCDWSKVGVSQQINETWKQY